MTNAHRECYGQLCLLQLIWCLERNMQHIVHCTSYGIRQMLPSLNIQIFKMAWIFTIYYYHLGHVRLCVAMLLQLQNYDINSCLRGWLLGKIKQYTCEFVIQLLTSSLQMTAITVLKDKMDKCVCVLSRSVMFDSTTHQAPLSMEFPRQEDWCGLPGDVQGNLPNPGTQVPYISCIGKQILYHCATLKAHIIIAGVIE